MHFRVRLMNHFMLSLISALLVASLYINLTSSLSVISNNNVRKEKYQMEELSYDLASASVAAAVAAGAASRSGITSSQWTAALNPGQHPQANQYRHLVSMDTALRHNKMDDLFVDTMLDTSSSPSDSDRSEPSAKQSGANLAAYNTISLDNSLEVEPEMLTNNHHIMYNDTTTTTTTAGTSYASGQQMNPKQDSRYYNSYNQDSNSSPTQSSSHHHHQYHLRKHYPHYHHHHHHYNNNNNNNYNNNNNNNNHQKQHYQAQQYLNHQYQAGSSQQHYGKYSPNIFSNNLNLNYIHGFLSGNSNNKPTLASNINLLNQYSQASGPVSSYISVAPTLSTSSPTSIQPASGESSKTASLSPSIAGEPSPQDVTASIGSTDNDNTISTSIDQPAPSFASKCGRQQVAVRAPRVVGGNNTYEGEFPWAVSIQRHGNHHCGGVIVDRRWILTAAHCVRSQQVGNLAVRTGGHTLSRSANGIISHLEKDYQVERIVMHDDFSRYDNLTVLQSKSPTNNADIALLKLRHNIFWNDLAWPVCFPDRSAGNFSGHDAIVIGWGKLNEKSEEFSNELQKVKLTIIDNRVCQNWFRQAGRDMPIDDRIICAGFKHGGKDACHGDSGGPLLSRINGQYVVVGVVSTGIGCARPLLPGLYSRVSSYIDWIERYISI